MNYARANKKWTVKDENTLRFCYGVFVMENLVRRLQRSPGAIRCKAVKINIQSTAGVYTLRGLVELTGYSYQAIKNTATRIGVNIRNKPRYFKRREATMKVPRYIISYDDAQSIVKALTGEHRTNIYNTREGEWGTGGKPANCVVCGTNEIPHEGRGMCNRCLWRVGKERQRSHIISSGQEA